MRSKSEFEVILEKAMAAQMKDVRELKRIEQSVASGVPPDKAASRIVKGRVQLSGYIKETLRGEHHVHSPTGS